MEQKQGFSADVEDRNTSGPSRRRKTRRFLINLRAGIVSFHSNDEYLYSSTEFEDLISEPKIRARRYLLLAKSVPLGLVIWVTDVVDIVVKLFPTTS